VQWIVCVRDDWSMHWRRSGSRSEVLPDVVMLVPDSNVDQENPSRDLLGVEFAESGQAGVESGDLVRYARIAARAVATRVSTARDSRAAGRKPQGVLQQERGRGDGHEVVQTCRVRPRLLESVVLGGELFSPPFERLEALDSPLRAGRADYVWTVRLRTGLVFTRVGTLHMSSTPSENLTVIELTPARRSRLGARRFVFRGISCVQEVARRVELLAAAS